MAVEKGQEGTLHGRDEPVDEDLPFKLLFILDPTDVDDFNGIGLFGVNVEVEVNCALGPTVYSIVDKDVRELIEGVPFPWSILLLKYRTDE